MLSLGSFESWEFEEFNCSKILKAYALKYWFDHFSVLRILEYLDIHVAFIHLTLPQKKRTFEQGTKYTFHLKIKPTGSDQNFTHNLKLIYASSKIQ